MHANVYGAVIVAKPLQSSPGSFDECRTAPSDRPPQSKPDDLGCESACRLPESTPAIAI